MAVFSGGGTGGHLYPALALSDALTELRPDIVPFFVGAERGLEARVLPERGFDHLLLPVRGLIRGALWKNVGVLWGHLRSLIRTGLAFGRLRPAVVVVTGGYAGGPAGITAWFMGIPLALQEQNSYPGVTTRLLSRLSRQIHLAYPEARDHLPAGVRERARVTGNPIRTPRSEDQAEARGTFGLEPDGPVVLVVGGSQGSVALNRGVLDAVRQVEAGALERPKGLQLLWATGPANYEHVSEVLDSLGSPGWVHPRGYIEAMGTALSAAEVSVSRAGASTTSELLAWGVPSVLVPLPSSAEAHQAHNAEALANAGAAVHLPESELDGGSLWEALGRILGNATRWQTMREAALQRSNPSAGRVIASDLATLLPPHLEVPLRNRSGTPANRDRGAE